MRATTGKHTDVRVSGFLDSIPFGHLSVFKIAPRRSIISNVNVALVYFTTLSRLHRLDTPETFSVWQWRGGSDSDQSEGGLQLCVDRSRNIKSRQFLHLSSRVLFLERVSAAPQGSARWCQQFRPTKTRNGCSGLLATLNLCVRIKIRVETFGTGHSVTDSMQTVQ